MTELEDVFAAPTEAEQIKQEISSLLESILKSELSLASGYAKLGRLGLQVQRGRHWESWGYTSFGHFINYVGEQINRGKSQIYCYVGVAEELLPYISDETMDKMGVSRAIELARFVKKSGRPPTQKLLEAALDPKVKLDALHVEIQTELHEKGEVLGKWFEPLQGFYATDDEKKEIRQGVEAVKRVLPEILSLPDHIQRKEIMLALCREFQSSYPPEGK